MASSLQLVRAAQKKVARYAFVIAIIVVASLGIYLSRQDASTPLGNKLVGLGINLVSSAVFASIFAYLSDGAQSELVRSEIREAFEGHASQLLTEWRSQVAVYVPSGQYPATAGFDISFNRALMKELNAAKTYCFRGVTAKYVPIRLTRLRCCPSVVKLIVADPRSSSAINRRVADRTRNPKYANKPPAVLLEEMLEELKESLVAVFDCRFSCSIEIALLSETFVTRTELTDKTVFISLYHAVSSRGHHFPETVKFDSSSFEYHINQMDTERRIDLADYLIKFNYQSNEADLCDALSKLFDESITPNQLFDLRASYLKRLASFDDFLGQLDQVQEKEWQSWQSSTRFS